MFFRFVEIQKPCWSLPLSKVIILGKHTATNVNSFSSIDDYSPVCPDELHSAMLVP